MGGRLLQGIPSRLGSLSDKSDEALGDLPYHNIWIITLINLQERFFISAPDYRTLIAKAVLRRTSFEDSSCSSSYNTSWGPSYRL